MSVDEFLTEADVANQDPLFKVRTERGAVGDRREAVRYDLYLGETFLGCFSEWRVTGLANALTIAILKAQGKK